LARATKAGDFSSNKVLKKALQAAQKTHLLSCARSIVKQLLGSQH
jgi:hypothetical protein